MSQSETCAHRAAVLLTTILLLACSWQAPAEDIPTSISRTPAQPAAMTRIRVLSVKYMSFGPFHIAQDEGYFADEGLDVEYMSMSRGFDGLPALSQGKLDVWAGGVNAGLFNIIVRGGDIRIVADKGYVRSPDDRTFTFVVRAELVKSGKVSQVSDLKGLRFSHQTATSGEYGISRLLARAGLKMSDIRASSLGNELLPQAMAEGTVDAALLTEPWATTILRQGTAVAWMRMPEVTPDFQYGLIAFGPTLLRENPDAGVRFMRAYLRAVKQFMEGKTERNMEILARHTQLEPDLLKAAGWTIIHLDGRPNIDSLMDFQKWGVENGYQDALLQPEQFWDARFVDAATASQIAPE